MSHFVRKYIHVTDHLPVLSDGGVHVLLLLPLRGGLAGPHLPVDQLPYWTLNDPHPHQKDLNKPREQRALTQSIRRSHIWNKAKKHLLFPSMHLKIRGSSTLRDGQCFRQLPSLVPRQLLSRLAPQAAVAQTGPPGSCCPDWPPKQLLPRLAHQAAVAQTGPPSSCCPALLLHISTIIQIMLEYVHAPCITICTTCTASIRHASTGFGTGVYKYIYIYMHTFRP